MSPTRGSSFFLGKVTALGVLCCFALFVCLTLLASFFLPSHLSFKNMYIHVHVHVGRGRGRRCVAHGPAHQLAVCMSVRIIIVIRPIRGLLIYCMPAIADIQFTCTWHCTCAFVQTKDVYMYVCPVLH